MLTIALHQHDQDRQPVASAFDGEDPIVRFHPRANERMRIKPLSVFSTFPSRLSPDRESLSIRYAHILHLRSTSMQLTLFSVSNFANLSASSFQMAACSGYSRSIFISKIHTTSLLSVIFGKKTNFSVIAKLIGRKREHEAYKSGM